MENIDIEGREYFLKQGGQIIPLPMPKTPDDQGRATLLSKITRGERPPCFERLKAADHR
jgi:hypothetical protein